MRKRILAFSVIGFIAAAFIFFAISQMDLTSLRISPKPGIDSDKSSKPIIDKSTIASQIQKSNNPGSIDQLPASISGKYDPSLPQWQEWRRRNEQDKKWEWKVGISFYGRVLDQYNNPIEGAKVVVSWTDLSVKGSTVRELMTNSQGDFSLTGVSGRHLLVTSISKQGYVSSAKNRSEFEYAAFFDEKYYVPDANNPVVFQMHKTATAEPLFVVSKKFPIPNNGVVGVDLKSGRFGGQDVIIQLLDNSDPTGKRWSAKILAPSGGVQFAEDEFAVIAPESGYQNEALIDQDTQQAAGFQSGSLYKGGKFFVKTSSGYGLVEFRMIPGNKSLRLTSFLNPNSSSRNLEFDPAKAIKPE